jgi:hypothetical protein
VGHSGTCSGAGNDKPSPVLPGIGKEEALAAIVANTLPSEFASMVDAILDEEIQWQARMLLAGATEFKRSNWFVDFFAAMKSLSSEYMDGFWRAGALLD